MRRVAMAAMAAIAAFALTPAHAASDMTSFGVHAIVVSGCTVTPQALSGRAPANVCGSAAASPGMPAPQPVVSMTHDDATGIDIMQLEF